jgi:hypothetical protein
MAPTFLGDVDQVHCVPVPILLGSSLAGSTGGHEAGIGHKKRERNQRLNLVVLSARKTVLAPWPLRVQAGAEEVS